MEVTMHRFEPIGQYVEIPSMKQGRWTDVYAVRAVCAVLCMAITGRASMAAVRHLMRAELMPVGCF